MLSIQEIIFKLQTFWSNNGCSILQPIDLEVGAGTSHPSTFLRAIGPEPWSAAYVQPSRRPGDGRYGNNPNRLQHYFQFQVIKKPNPDNIIDLYLDSLNDLGISQVLNDIRFVEDNWENPTLWAWGLGWEIWLNGMEVTQFTYFQQVAGIDCKPISSEITYGIERLAMCIQEKESVYDLEWNKAGSDYHLSYSDLYHQNEFEHSTFNFEKSKVSTLVKIFDLLEEEVSDLLESKLAIPAYEQTLKSAHIFNLLEARGAISITERTNFIKRIRKMSKEVGVVYLRSRETLGFPLLK